jgi:hypothetical protein
MAPKTDPKVPKTDHNQARLGRLKTVADDFQTA